MFEVYKTIATTSKAPVKYTQIDLNLFKMLKEIITHLLAVKPEKRMKLQDAREKLEELDQFTKIKDFNYLLLNSVVPRNSFIKIFIQDDPTLINTTENSLRLMNEIRTTRLCTIPTTTDDKKINQILLFDSLSAMRLLSHAIVEFLEKHFNGDSKALKELTDKILECPENFESSKKTTQEREAVKAPVYEAGGSSNAPDGFKQGLNPVKKEPYFIHKLLIICCGVISPRTLNGFNHYHPEQNFRK